MRLTVAELAELSRRARYEFESDRKRPHRQEIPAWAWMIEEAIRACGRPRQARARFLRADDPLPFEELFVPFVYVARRGLRALARPHRAIISSGALAALERDLLKTLVDLSAPILQTHFLLTLVRTRPMGARAGGGAAGREAYAAFVEEFLGDGLGRLFREYPVLARLLGTVMLDWVEMSAAFLRHLRRDRRALQATFGGVHPGPVVTVRSRLSDRHEGGRTVMRVRFASGLILMYKPRDCGMEAALSALLGWLNRRTPPLDSRALRVVNRRTHGWIEFVHRRGCTTIGQVHAYFARAGMLQCLLFVLGGTDCHMGNLVSAGPHPVLVDAECVCQPRRRADGGALDRDELLHTGMFPLSTGGGVPGGVDTSGLWGRGLQPAGLVIPRWRHVNTDEMTLRFVRALIKPQPNAVSARGVAVRPGAFLDQFLDGFSRMAALLVKHKAELLAPRGPLARFRKHRTRILLRGTYAYFLTLNRSVHPGCLRDARTRSAVLAASMTPLVGASRRRFPHARARELEALAKLDVPTFFLQACCPWRAARRDFALRLATLGRRPLSRHLRRLRSAWTSAMLSSRGRSIDKRPGGR